MKQETKPIRLSYRAYGEEGQSMLYIKKSDFDRLRRNHNDYISRALIDHEFNGKICRRGEWMGFAATLTGDPAQGTKLLFEHIHFEIVPG